MGATGELVDERLSCGGSDQPRVWYRVESYDEGICITTPGHGIGTSLVVIEAPECAEIDDADVLECAIDGVSPSRVDFFAESDHYYYVGVASTGGTGVGGEFSIKAALVGADADGDSVDDCNDLCPDHPDPLGAVDDVDGDGIGDACDICPFTPNAAQRDRDGDGIGDACDWEGYPPVQRHVGDPLEIGVRLDSLSGIARPEIRFYFDLVGLDDSPGLPLPTLANEISMRSRCVGEPGVLDPNDPFEISVLNPSIGSRSPDNMMVGAQAETDPVTGVTQEFYPAVLFNVFEEAAYNSFNDVRCFFEISQQPGAISTGEYGLSVVNRTKHPETQSVVGGGNGALGDYGQFDPEVGSFAFIDNGISSLGTCSISTTNTTVDVSHEIAFDAPENEWNCCTWTYEDENQQSSVGHAAFSTGGTPPGPSIADRDSDGFYNECDTCPDHFDPTQADSGDGDSFADACDSCPQSANEAQQDNDGIPAGDACQCSDIDGDGLRTIRDVFLMQRASIGFPLPADADISRCQISTGMPRCGSADINPLRAALVEPNPLLIESCAWRDLQNGGFESGSFDGWIAEGNVFLAATQSSEGAYAAHFNRFDTAPNGMLSQTIQSSGGTLHTLEFDFAQIGGGTQELLVEIEGGGQLLVSSIVTDSSVSGATDPNPSFETFAFPFVPNTSEVTIRFRDQLTNTTASTDTILDDIVVR